MAVEWEYCPSSVYINCGFISNNITTLAVYRRLGRWASNENVFSFHFNSFYGAGALPGCSQRLILMWILLATFLLSLTPKLPTLNWLLLLLKLSSIINKNESTLRATTIRYKHITYSGPWKSSVNIYFFS